MKRLIILLLILCLIAPNTAEAKKKRRKTRFISVTEKIKYNEPMKEHLTKQGGVFYGVSGKETYYNLPMNGVIRIMRSMGYTEKEYPYWVRYDGVKMFGYYVMAAANLNIRPRGTIIKTSLGEAIICDTGGFAKHNPTQLDIAVTW